jgi:hypothetical protein
MALQDLERKKAVEQRDRNGRTVEDLARASGCEKLWEK